MDAIADYEKWNATRQQHLQQWLLNPDGAASVPPEHRIMAWTILISAIVVACGAAYFLFRYRSRLWVVVKSAIATVIIAVIRAARYLRAEASDIRMQVSRGLDQSGLSEGRTSTITKPDHKPGRLRLAGRMFFNLAIAPVLLGGVLIGAAVIASKLGFLE